MLYNEKNLYKFNEEETLIQKLDEAIDSMERGELIPHEQAMEIVREKVFKKNV
jgi:hypothetical protein